jgi:hypothetical protein
MVKEIDGVSLLALSTSRFNDRQSHMGHPRDDDDGEDVDDGEDEEEDGDDNIDGDGDGDEDEEGVGDTSGRVRGCGGDKGSRGSRRRGADSHEKGDVEGEAEEDDEGHHNVSEGDHDEDSEGESMSESESEGEGDVGDTPFSLFFPIRLAPIVQALQEGYSTGGVNVQQLKNDMEVKARIFGDEVESAIAQLQCHGFIASISVPTPTSSASAVANKRKAKTVAVSNPGSASRSKLNVAGGKTAKKNELRSAQPNKRKMLRAS